MQKKKEIAVVFMVAGLSSRFGGKIKQFARVGPEGETLIEFSINQALKAGFGKIVFIVGRMTEQPFKKKFGNSFKGIPIEYALQSFDPEERDKPWGTVDALVSVKEIVKENFAVCNGDDIYGKNAFKTVAKALQDLKANEGIAIGYKLGKVLPETGLANRGIFKLGKNSEITEIQEMIGVGKENIHQLSLNGNSPCSMNLFGLTPQTLGLLEKRLLGFRQKNAGDRKIECLLPVELGNLIKNGELELKLLNTEDQWFGITNPEDEEKVRQQLASI
ncbi:MAG: sugar phosphate nucleotidyltransferase [Candidatus Diapherotrites archaeon]|nr:sugar phosphate nucleotidyltransferase [Candidatus Diapherotrites archaeon]